MQRARCFVQYEKDFAETNRWYMCIVRRGNGTSCGVGGSAFLPPACTAVRQSTLRALQVRHAAAVAVALFARFFTFRPGFEPSFSPLGSLRIFYVRKRTE